MGRRAASSLKCILPAGVCSGRVWRWEFECLAHCFTGVFLPSGAVCKVERTLLYQEVWRLSGTIRVNGRNCKDCPETDGKQSLNGIENRCEA